LHSDENKRYSRNVPNARTDPEAARRQVERVLASPGFHRNERMSRFLRFLAERHLEGNGNQLKESVIAVEVFGRKPDHDPVQDSIVRTEAGRLRGRLAEYYVGEGKDDAMVIELPKGGYTPAFRLREPEPPPVLPDRPTVSDKPAPPTNKKIGRRVWLVTAAVAMALVIAAIRWVQVTERFWRNPIEGARFQIVADFDGTEQEAAVSRDGKFVAFLSSREGQTDIWVTQPGSGQFNNLTRGSISELGNPSLRALAFSPDSSLVLFWLRKQVGASWQIGTWAIPTLGGPAKVYLDGVAEFDWSLDGSRFAYHTPAAGDPLFVSDGAPHAQGQPIFTAPTGLHSHFPLWAPDNRFIYVDYGALPDKMDIWRIKPVGGMPERITSHNGRVSHPVFLNRRTLMYLASAPDGSGPWLYSIDVERRILHRLTFGPDRYTSLSATADGKRLVVTRASPKSTLWRMRIGDSSAELLPPARIALTPANTFSPRLGPDYLICVSSTGTSESIWKLANGADTELWSGDGAQIIGSPAISPDGGRIAFSVRQRSQTLLYAMQADGTHARVVADSLELRGSPAWTPDGRSITTAANDRGVPHLFQVPTDGGSPVAFLRDYSVEPAWAPSGRFVVYSGPDIGTTFSVKAAAPDGLAHSLPLTTLTRGARHVKFLSGGRGLVFLRGGIEHKDLWLMDPETGAERQLTNLPGDFDIRDFDISPDGREVVLERVQERSDIVLLDLDVRSRSINQ
jgi:Tol biopolymer transport system component